MFVVGCVIELQLPVEKIVTVLEHIITWGIDPDIDFVELCQSLVNHDA
jgi:hypothetical protein